MIKKVKEMINLIAQEGSHKQYKHLLKKGKVTIPDHGANKDLDHKIVKSILIQAGLTN
jgi:predicted RNA binding protein YcfA (HicA-like mRNA interferase family)